MTVDTPPSSKVKIGKNTVIGDVEADVDKIPVSDFPKPL